MGFNHSLEQIKTIILYINPKKVYSFLGGADGNQEQMMLSSIPSGLNDMPVLFINSHRINEPLQPSLNNSPGKPQLPLPIFKVMKTRFSVE